ncbi:MAG: glycosyltransferase family 2 protein [Acidimicrobiales bacterium]
MSGGNLAAVRRRIGGSEFQCQTEARLDEWSGSEHTDVLHGLRVSVVIPALNEADNLPHVFTELPVGLHEVVLVDGHSVDDTIEVAKRLRPDIRVVLQARRGKGDALAAGFAACTGDVIVMMDADGSTDPKEIPRFVDALVEGADFAKGSRHLPGGGSADLTWLRRTGNRVLSLVVNLLYGTKYTDLCYGYNAFRASCLESLSVDCPGFEVETLINIRVSQLGLKVAEVPSFEGDRINGTSNLHPIRDGLRVLRVILRERFVRVEPTAHVYEHDAPSQWALLEPTA